MEDRFTARLRELRHVQGLTQERLADESGLSVRGIRDLERGRSRAPRGSTASLLADALRLTGPERDQFLALAAASRTHGDDDPAGPVHRTPQQLPPAINDLTGRAPLLDHLAALATAGRTAGPVVVVLHGLTGSGKSSLAVNAGHRVRRCFPHGQLFVDLAGSTAEPLDPMTVLDRLLRALGTPPGWIPGTLAERIAYWRTLTRNGRLLLVLDDAAHERQVRPLLPTGPGCLVLITSWVPLAGLDSVRRLHLPPLDPRAAGQLLHAIIGDRATAEPACVEELAGLCAYLPLALRIAGNLLAGRPSWHIARLVERLRDPARRLGALTAGDHDLRAAFAAVHDRLPAEAATVFRRCAALGRAPFGVAPAALAAGLPAGATAVALETLVDAGLLATDGERYRFNELVRLYAAERSRAGSQGGRR